MYCGILNVEMNTPFRSFEWFDAMSRQGSELSRTSFNTARTDNQIYYECEEPEYFENETDLPFIRGINYNSDKSVTYKFPKMISRSKSMHKSDGLYKLSNKSSSDRFQERNRSKTTPCKELMLGFMDNITSNDEFIVEPLFGEFFTNKKDIFSKNLAPNMELISEENNENIVNTQDGFECFGDDKPKINSTNTVCEKYLFIGSNYIEQNHEKKQENYLQACDSERNCLKGSRVKLDGKILLEAIPLPYPQRSGGKNTLKASAISTETASQSIDYALSIDQNKNLYEKKLLIEPTNIFVEGEIDTRRVSNRSDCIFSALLHLKNVCCLSD